MSFNALNIVNSFEAQPGPSLVAQSVLASLLVFTFCEDVIVSAIRDLISAGGCPMKSFGFCWIHRP
jgi:hypothetical protein